MLDSLGTGHWLRGSAGASLKPVLIVDYFVPSEQPGALVPDGGAVSVAAPILTYVGAEDMTAQKIDYSTDGVAVSYTTNWIPAVEGYYAPTGGEPVLTDGGDGIYWRATTDGPSGQSLPSEWAFYSYDSLPTVAITSPGATTPDGSPVMQWTVTGGVQTSWRALFQSDGQTIDEAKWTIDAATRDWTPGKSIAVPDALGLYTLEVRDDVTPRVAAPNAPTTRTVTVAFETTLDGAATAVDTIDCTYDEPVPIISGTRAAGVPDEVALVRDGVIVPLWDDDGNIYTTWAPGALFFSGTDYTLLDYTAEPRTSPTWGVRTRTGGTTVSAAGPTVTKYIATGTVWLVNPVTGERVEVCGADGAAGPVVDQATVEQSIVHVPINGGVLVEPKRRRLLRTTKSGSVAGMVQGEAEGVLTGWAEGDSATRYRLIFGKVNWTVIIGDYDPLDVFYPDDWGPDRVNIALNWWQRLGVI
jgi:hypothetical protein